MNRDQGFGHQANNRAGSNSPCPAATGTEQLLLGLAPQVVDQVQAQSDPDATSAAAKRGKADSAYVSFDEWQAQVHAKQIQQNSPVVVHNPSDQQLFSWLPGVVMPGSASRATGGQYGMRDFQNPWHTTTIK